MWNKLAAMSFKFSVILSILFAFSGNASVDAMNVDTATASSISIGLAPEGAEGNFFNTSFSFRIDRVGDLSAPCSFSFETREGTALSPEDFQAISGTYAFNPGQSVALVVVTVIGDPFAEADETFFMHINSSSNCSIGNTSTAMATILGDDPSPTLCMHLVEGDTTGDAAIRVNDLARLRRGVLGLDDSLIYGCSLRMADINGDCGDGRLDTADVTTIRQWILNGGGQRPACGPIGPPPV